MLIVNLTGVHDAGKLDLFEELAEAMTEKGYKVKTSEVEGGYYSVQLRAKALGLKIEEQTTAETQYYLAVANIESDIRNRLIGLKEKADLLISVRSVCDVLAYTQYLIEHTDSLLSHEPRDELLRMTMEMLSYHIAAYPVDVMFSPEPLPFFKRSKTSKEFQNRIRKTFQQVWASNQIIVDHIPVFNEIDYEQNQKSRVRYCTKVLLNRLGERLC